MKKKKKSLLFFFSFALVLLAACGENANSEGKTTIEFMHSSVEQERLSVIDSLIERFEEENPDIEVEQVVVEESNLNTKIITLAFADQLPEVIEVGQDYARILDEEQLIDQEALESVLEDNGTENYYEGALDLVRTEDGDSFRGVPISGWVQGIWYDIEKLASQGFEEPQSWDELREIAEAFTDRGNQQYGIAIPTVENSFSEQGFSQFALSNQANVLNQQGEVTVDTPEMHEALSYYQELSRFTMPGSNDTTEVRDAFMNGTVPMAMYSTYILPTIFEQGDPENIGFAIPTEEERAVYGSVSALTITSGLEQEKKEASQKFISFMTEVENNTEWVLMSPGGAQPVHKGIAENETYQNNEVIQAFGDLSNELAASFEDIQVFGLAGNKNFTKMGDITSSGAIPLMINNVTVGDGNVSEEIEKVQTAIQEATE